jgi:phytoene desaturase
LEKMPILGGRFPWVEYKGYLIPTAALTIYYGERDPVLLTLKDVGGRTDFEMKALLPPKWRIGGKDYEMPPKGMMWYLISLASRDKEEEARVITALRRCFRWKVPSDSITFSEWLLRITDNRAIWNIFQAWCVQIVGLNLYEISAGDLVRCFVNFAGAQQLIPTSGLNPIIDALAKVIRDNKGEILTSVRARRIVVNDGIAEGVQAAGPDFELSIEAKVVVSDIGPEKTVELAGEENFDRGYLSEVRELRPLEGFWFMVSSNGPLYDWPGGLYAPESRRWQLGVDYSLVSPEFAPPGKNWMGFYQAPGHASLYDPTKEYKMFLADLAEMFSNFRKQDAEILLVRHFCSEWPCVRAWPASERHQKTSIENLYNVGDAVNPAGWMAGSGVAEGARMVAEEIKARTKPGT